MTNNNRDGRHRAELSRIRNVIYKERKTLIQFYLQTGPTDTHTHTQKKLDPVGLFGRAGPGYLSHLVRSHRPRTTTVGLEPTTLALSAPRLQTAQQRPQPHRDRHQDCRLLNHDHRPRRNRHQDCRPLNHDHRPLRNHHEHSCLPSSRLFFSLEVGGVSFLAPRLLIGRGVVG